MHFEPFSLFFYLLLFQKKLPHCLKQQFMLKRPAPDYPPGENQSKRAYTQSDDMDRMQREIEHLRMQMNLMQAEKRKFERTIE